MRSSLVSVTTTPGAIALTRMPRWPHSTAMVPVRLSIPALAAAYCPVIGAGLEPLREEMLMIEPPRSITRGAPPPAAPPAGPVGDTVSGERACREHALESVRCGHAAGSPAWPRWRCRSRRAPGTRYFRPVVRPRRRDVVAVSSNASPAELAWTPNPG